MANAAANGTLLAIPTFCSITFPRKLEPAPPINMGVMKSPRVSENVKIEPAITPGRARGRMTRRTVHHPLAPRSAEAST